MDATQLDVVWDGFRYLYAPRLAENVFQLSPKPIQILKKLSTDACADLQFLLNDGDPSPASALHPSAETLTSKRIRPSETVSVIIYGPEDLAEVVGRWLGKMNLYLQTPRACSQDVRYRNPQSFAFYDNQIILTSQLPSAASGSEHIDEQAPTDPFAALYNESVLEEAPQPHAIASSLHRHQRQALTFMGRREEGWNYLGSGDSIWQSYVDRFGVTKYKDTVSGLTQEHEPDMFRGGIIADEMGLGKTCSMLALIAANPSTIQPTRPDRPTYFQGPALKATLIVVPFPLLFVWEKQILEHFRRGSTQHLIYYGTARSQALCFDKFDIVITTYNIVGQEWQSYKSPQTSQAPRKLFEREWHRIVLDEAHVIRNPGRICAKSVCALRSERRWCITGTPIQNHLTDLSSLFRFLRLHPYNKRAVWDEHILKPWKSQADVAALKKLQKIMKTIAIRRTSSIINLPLRHEIAIEVSFSPEERAHYEHACKGVLDVLDAASESSTSIGSVYLNTFQRINDMRYICNHGLRPPRPHSARHLNKASITSSQSFQELGFDALEDALESLCIQCGLEIVDSEESVLNLLTENEGSSDVSPAQLCRACLSSDQTTNSPLPLNESSSPSRPSSPRPGGCLSSKLRALVDEILKLPPDDKCVIFSYWTTSLDAVQEALRPLGVQFCRYDGKLTRQQREAVLGRFASDQTTKVFLVSISCGGQGLDLTAANHAFLLEPQWNPMLEEQAMARIHRLGQKKPVRCVRFLVKNTWEEKIVILQRRKRNLAGLVVDRSPVKEGVVGKKHLYYLRELIG
jgi:SNF2 family DNA or RNA helicase